MEHEVIEAENEQQAVDEAYYQALERYDDYAGLHGIQSKEDIAEEENLTDEDEIELIYNEARESWINYDAEIYDSEKHDDYL